ncbi:hypothetical protein KSP39_PZI004039 [Platanthera zijinensis]|uniref:Glycosyl transferase CAP10 domain-containing protein n=1 Tax=Platanthera zijinensis TaxID=2320716 RepID=A0AAP0GCF7_9ASPA
MEGFPHGNVCAKATKRFNAVSISTKAFVFVIFSLFVGAFITSRWIDPPFFLNKLWDSSNKNQPPQPAFALVCATNQSSSAAANPSIAQPPEPHAPPPTHPPSSAPACPNYFRWIYEDLKPWASTGITKETLESAEIHAAFRIVIINGRAYIRHYHSVFQTRDTFTIWGIIQLLRRYPGRVPDIDLMFNCEDMPVVLPAVAGTPPPPLFRYCKDDSTVDIVFPDWSFWGWPEVNIRWWGALSEELREANEAQKWSKRKPYAYWKGNPDVAEVRGDLMKCNVTKAIDWKARLFSVNWEKERREGFPSSNLASKCKYRYNIYVEGRAWSVSEKYILACDSPTLYVESKYQDFVSRGLRPGRHYWPIPRHNKCQAIKQAVERGSDNSRKVQAIGKSGSRFINEDLKMEKVYEYMLQLLTEYSRLLTYKPTMPEKAVELSMESVACPFEGKVREYLLESVEREPSKSEPCAMPPPFSPQELAELLMEKANGAKKAVNALMH